MSRISNGSVPILRVVCEGDTDFVVIEAALGHLLDDFVATMVQPERAKYAGNAYTEMGSGWKGVRKWCQQTRDEFGGVDSRLSRSLRGADAVIIHVDVDIASKDELDCVRPCPPAGDTADEVRAKVYSWLGGGEGTTRLVLCVPSMSTETWVVAALYPGDRFVDDTIECKDAEADLCGRPGPKLVRRRRGRRGYQKDSTNFRDQAPKVTAEWSRVADLCSQAGRFSRDITEVCSSSSDDEV